MENLKGDYDYKTKKISPDRKFSGPQKSGIFAEIGLKSGIEIHQQLDTHKLFCFCPSLLRQDKPDFSVERKLHAVAGESGEIDVAARHEALQEKTFFYEGYKDANCLVELDESPPEQINQEALETALQISLLLNCEILPVTQIMRKTVIDGSNTSGFQRTVIIARKGYIETEYGKVGIDNVSLEEDAARIISQEKGKTIFRLDRLGIPLVEIGTAPDIKTPEQAKQVALHIGDILRSCKVKRGIGTIRQDVNMSIKQGGKQGKRIEIKGVQEPGLISKTIIKEIERQFNLAEQGKKLEKGEVRKAEIDGTTTFLRPLPGAARMYPETDLSILKISREMINSAKKNLPKLKTELREELRERGLNEEMIKLVLSENKIEEMKALLKLYNKPNFIVKALLLYPKEIASHQNIKNIENILTTDIIESIIEKVAKKKIAEENVKQIMTEIAKGRRLEEAMKKEKLEAESLEAEILKLLKQKTGLSQGAYMGLLMQKYKGKISGKEISEILKKHIK